MTDPTPPLTEAEAGALNDLQREWENLQDGEDEMRAAVAAIRAAHEERVRKDERERCAAICDARAASLFAQRPMRSSEAGEASKCASAVRGSGDDAWLADALRAERERVLREVEDMARAAAKTRWREYEWCCAASWEFAMYALADRIAALRGEGA